MINLPAAPTFAELVARLKSEFGCSCSKVPGEEEPPVWEITRVVEGEELYYLTVIEYDDYPLAPSLVRSICDRLKIDPGAFGLGVTGWA